MNVLLFTHKSDIDGMGNVVLAKLAFQKVEYVLCETFNLQEEVKKYLDNEKIYSFDRIFVTDLWLEEPTLSEVANNERLRDKFYVFDHHKSALEGNFNKYSFVTIKVFNDKGLCSGTSLFYDYLVSNGLIDGNNKIIEEFGELTRKYDTWEWKTKYNEEKARWLTLLFDAVGCSCYIELMVKKLSNGKENSFKFNELEEMLIDNKINQVQEKLVNYAKKVYYTNVFGLKAGVA